MMSEHNNVTNNSTLDSNGNNQKTVDDEFASKLESAQLKFKKLAQRKKRREERAEYRRAHQEAHSHWFKKLKNWWPLSKISGRILLIYLLTVLIGGFLLAIPGVVKASEHHWDYMSGIFTASSAFSDTGIVVLQTNTDYSFWGQLLIVIMIQIGGIGILTFKIVVFIIIRRKISLNDQSIAQSERGSSILSNTVETIRDGFIFLTCVEIIGAITLFFGFYFSEPETEGLGQVTNTYQNFGTSLWASIFHSISAVNNAGFDIISKSSILPYNSPDHRGYLIQVVFLLQWVIGGLGYPTFHDIKKKIKARREGRSVKFSLFTKLNFYTYTTLLIIGPLLVFGTEAASSVNSDILYNAAGQKNPWYVSFMDIVFNVTASRNAGFSTVDINHFNAGSQMIFSVWMFVGSAPSSTAGGIRTTTFAICCLGVLSIIRNKSTIDTNRRRIPDATVKRSFAVFFLSVLLVISAVFIIYFDSKSAIIRSAAGDENIVVRHDDITAVQLFVLVCSAFGTVGFSPYNLLSFGVLSKIVLILCMFIGQLGISNMLLAFIKPSNKQRFAYVEEDVVIG